MPISRHARSAGAVSAGTLALVLGGAGAAFAGSVGLPASTTLPSPGSVLSSTTSTVTRTVSGLLSPTPAVSPTPTPAPTLPNPDSVVSSVAKALPKLNSSPAPTATATSRPGSTSGSAPGGRLGSGVHVNGLSGVRPPALSPLQFADPPAYPASGLGSGPALAPQLLAGLGNLDAAALPAGALAPELAPSAPAMSPQLAPPTAAPQPVRLAAGSSPAGGLPAILVVVAIATVGAAAAAHLGVLQQRLGSGSRGMHAA